MTTYKAVYGQSIFDVCLNTYGTLDYLLKLITDNGIANINYTPASGQSFVWDENLTADQQVNQVSSNSKIIYATATLLNSSVLSVVRIPDGEGFDVPQYVQPVNQENLNQYQITLEYQYVAGTVESSLSIADLIGAQIIQITRETQPLRTSDYAFNTNTGQITLNGSPLEENETLYIIYSKIITV